MVPCHYLIGFDVVDSLLQSFDRIDLTMERHTDWLTNWLADLLIDQQLTTVKSTYLGLYTNIHHTIIYAYRYRQNIMDAQCQQTKSPGFFFNEILGLYLITMLATVICLASPRDARCGCDGPTAKGGAPKHHGITWECYRFSFCQESVSYRFQPQKMHGFS